MSELIFSPINRMRVQLHDRIAAALKAGDDKTTDRYLRDLTLRAHSHEAIREAIFVVNELRELFSEEQLVNRVTFNLTSDYDDEGGYNNSLILSCSGDEDDEGNEPDVDGWEDNFDAEWLAANNFDGATVYRSQIVGQSTLTILRSFGVCSQALQNVLDPAIDADGETQYPAELLPDCE